eukprot:354845-Chlamydomonas_euryale.AAC.1
MPCLAVRGRARPCKRLSHVCRVCGSSAGACVPHTMACWVGMQAGKPDDVSAGLQAGAHIHVLHACAYPCKHVVQHRCVHVACAYPHTHAPAHVFGRTPTAAVACMHTADRWVHVGRRAYGCMWGAGRT